MWIFLIGAWVGNCFLLGCVQAKAHRQQVIIDDLLERITNMEDRL